MRFTKWYPVSSTGKLVTLMYGVTPFYTFYVDNLGFLTNIGRTTVVCGMLFVSGVVLYARKKRHKLFCRNIKHPGDSGFTLIELLVVISIIGILSAIVLPSFISARQKAYLSRSKAELHYISTALELYANDHNGVYPPDANRDMPPGLEPYLTAGGSWPKAPWPNSVYDWDNWTPASLSFDPKQQVYQISIRFCPAGGTLSQCSFPKEPWAANFDVDSAVYSCVSGPCRAHSSHEITYPGYCVNC